MSDWPDFPPEIKPKPRGPHPLAVKMLAAQTAWLDAPLERRGAQVGWKIGEDWLAPDAAKLGETERALKTLKRHEKSATREIEEFATWLKTREKQLAIVKKLAVLRIGETKEIPVLVNWLWVEALAPQSWENAPSAQLAARPDANGPLEFLARDERAPLSARALAALILGARGQKRPADEGWIRRAWAFGVRHGLTEAPALAAQLLENGGEVAARRALRALKGGPQSLDAETLRLALNRGFEPEKVVQMAGIAAGLGEIWPVWDWPIPSDIGGIKRLEAARRKAPKVWREFEGRWRKIWRELAQKTGQSEVLINAHRFAVELALAPLELRESLNRAANGAAIAGIKSPAEKHGENPLLLIEMTEAVLEFVSSILSEAASLEPSTDAAFIEWLGENGRGAMHISNFGGKKFAGKPHKILAIWRNWLHKQRSRHFDPMRCLFARHPEIAREALQRGLHRVLWHYRWRDGELDTLFLRICALANNERSTAFRVGDALTTLKSAELARAVFAPIISASESLEPAWRAKVLDAALELTVYSPSELRHFLPRLAPFFATIAVWTEKPENAGEDSDFNTYRWLEAAHELIELEREGYKMPDAVGCLQFALRETNGSWDADYTLECWIDLWMRLSVVLAQGEPEKFQRFFQVGWKIGASRDFRWSPVFAGVKALRAYPFLIGPLVANWEKQPARCLKLLERLGHANRLGPDAIAGLTIWKNEIPTPDLPEDWAEIPAELESVARRYLGACQLAGKNGELPSGARKILDWPCKWAKEIEFLSAKVAQNPALQARLDSLQERLSDESETRTTINAELGDLLTNLAAETELEAAEAILEACYRSRLEILAGRLPENLELSPDLFNAALLSADIEHNRKWLRELLRRHFAGQKNWREQVPANARFLESLGEKRAIWQSEMPRRYNDQNLLGGRVHLRFERDPLHILQMGNYFDTCLSFGGINSFSTVANAVELNKRVIYARDARGVVIGRKLIGLNEAGKVIGFYTYSSQSGEADKALRAIFRDFCLDFARRCGLETDANGTVPRLFCEQWYDDGCQSWDEEAGKTGKRRGSAPTVQRAPKHD